MNASDYINQRYEADREVDRFLKGYEATAGLGHKRYYRRQPIRFTDYLGDTPYQHVDVETEQMVEMNIPQHQFRRLVEREAEFQDMIRHNERANQVLHQHRVDERVRNENPAVQKAYMKYLTLLELARK